MLYIHYALTISALFQHHPLLPQEHAEEMKTVQEITNAVEEDASKLLYQPFNVKQIDNVDSQRNV